ncbi:UNVERIFIED_CONTAM: hypothetical protein DES50_101244 [Williamsia faeni]
MVGSVVNLTVPRLSIDIETAGEARTAQTRRTGSTRLARFMSADTGDLVEEPDRTTDNAIKCSADVVVGVPKPATFLRLVTAWSANTTRQTSLTWHRIDG